MEKALKAYLIARGIEFEKLHDLRRLLDYCAGADPDFEQLRGSVEPLTLYAVAFRYPGPAEPSREDVATALGVIERVWAFVTTPLPDDVLP